MKNILRLITLVMVCLMVFGSLSVMAITPYSTYTYDIDGMYAASPDAYTPDAIIDSAAMGLDGSDMAGLNALKALLKAN